MIKRSPTYAWIGFVLGGLAALGVGGCQDALDSSRTSLQTHAQKIRPTEPDSRVYYGDVDVENHTRPDSAVKVWWATEGSHRPPPADSDENGIPDYVELVRRIGDEVASKYQNTGFEQPIPDTQLVNDAERNGGDAKLDIYLQDFNAGDGHYASDACFPGSSDGAPRCSGHLRLENDFLEQGYPSAEYAVKVLVSHEYFHAIENGYHGDLPGWISEGAATWGEELIYPEQRDFESLANEFFKNHESQLNSKHHGPGDSWPYATSIFFYFLEQAYGAEVVVALFDELAGRKGFEAALTNSLKANGPGPSFARAVRKFFTWNAFTGSRAIDAYGYPQAAQFDEVDVRDIDVDGALNWETSVEPMSAKYGHLDIDRPTKVKVATVKEFDALSTVLVPVDEPFFDEIETVGPESHALLSPDKSPYIAVAYNPDLETRQAVRLKIRPGDDEQVEPDAAPSANRDDTKDSTDDEPETRPSSEDRPSPSIDSGDGSGCSTGATKGPLPPLGLACALLLISLPGRRRDRISRLAVAICLATLGCGLTGCGDIETTPTANETRRVKPPEHPETFTQEHYGVASSWYSYEPQSHTLNPKNAIYLFRFDKTWAVRIDSYYNDEGESGFFTLKTKVKSGDDFKDVRTIEISENVKERDVCLNLDSGNTVSCEDDSWHLLFRTEPRIVPAAGFAVSNPAIYVAGHWSGDTNPVIRALPEKSLSELEADKLETAEPLPSAQHYRNHGYVGSIEQKAMPSDAYLQAASDSQLIQWKIRDLSIADDSLTLKLSKRCLELANSKSNQTAFESTPVVKSSVKMSLSDTYTVGLLDLCDAAIEDVQSEPYSPLWPKPDGYDAFLEFKNGKASIRIPPGHLIWNATEHAEDQPTELTDMALPSHLWAQP